MAYSSSIACTPSWFSLCQVPTKATLSLPLLNRTGERKYNERLEGQDKDRERSLTNYCHGQNRLDLGKINITSQIKLEYILRNRTRSYKHLPPTLPFFPGSASLPFLSLLPLSDAEGQGMVVAVRSSHVVSAAPSSSGEGLLTLYPCPSMRSLSQETVLHNLLQCESFPRAAALHQLPQRGSLPRAAVLQEQAAPAWVPMGSQALPANLLRHGLLSPQVHRSWQEPAPAWAAHRVTASFRHPPALAWGPFHGLQVGICSTMDLHVLQGDNLPHHGLHHELQGISAQASGAPPPLLLHRPRCLQSCFSPIISLLSPAAVSFPPSLPSIHYPRSTTTISDGPSPGQQRVRLGASWHWLYRIHGKLLAAPHRSHPCSPLPLPKPCHANQIHTPWSFLYFQASCVKHLQQLLKEDTAVLSKHLLSRPTIVKFFMQRYKTLPYRGMSKLLISSFWNYRNYDSYILS